MSTAARADIAELKRAARCRWQEILSRLGGIHAELLDCRPHGCPKCGGKDRFRLIDADAGAVLCNQCFDTKNGDGLAALMWVRGWTFSEAVRQVGDYLGATPATSVQHRANGRPKNPRDLLADIEIIEDADQLAAAIEVWSKSKPPIKPQVVRRYQPLLCHWHRFLCLAFFGRDPREPGKVSAVLLYRVDGQQFPKVGRAGARKAHLIKGSQDSWLWPGGPAALFNAETFAKCEGLPDALALATVDLPALGLPITNVCGAMSTKKLDFGFARNKKANLFADADNPGLDGVEQFAARFCDASAFDVRVVHLPYSVEGSHGKDLRDYLAEGHTAADLLALVEAAPRYGESPGDRTAHLVNILDVGQKDLPKLTAEAWTAIRASNVPATLFRFGGQPARLERNDEGELLAAPLGIDGLRYELTERVRCVQVDSRIDGTTLPAIPPEVLLRNLLATPESPLPVLQRIVEAPVFGTDGQIQTEPGYHLASRTYFAPPAGFVVLPVSHQPLADEIDEARDLLVDELLGDFPFVSEADRAHALGLLLLPFVRDLIPGPTPLHLVEKPTPGTGASLLVEMLTCPATGRELAAMTEGRNEDEWRKRLTAKLRTAPAFVLLDNLRNTLDSAALSAAITAPVWEDRILGESTMGRYIVRCGWIGTANNPSVSHEIARRSIRIRLDAKRDRPWLREEFRHSHLRGWVAEHRGRLVWAALTLGQAWLAAGRPMGKQKLGMFEGWAAIIGGLLDVAHVPGFLANISEFYDQTDIEGQLIRGFVEAWWEHYRSAVVTGNELYELVTTGRFELPLGDKGDQSRRIKLGVLVGKLRDRVISLDLDDGPTTVAVRHCGTKQRAASWCLATDFGNRAG
jgi:hypothetical protein